MCVRSVRGLLDRRRGSVVDAVRWALGSQGPLWSLSIPSWKTTCRAAGGSLRLQRRDRPGFLVSWRCFDVPPCIPEALGLPGFLCGANGARGFCMCQRGKPSRVVAPVGVLGNFGAPPALEAPGRLETAAAGGLRRVHGSPLTQGFPKYHRPAWLHGCAGRRTGATVSRVHSFHPGCRRPYAP